MHDLTLNPGPRLTVVLSAEHEGRRVPKTVDVTQRAHEFLFETVTLAKGVTLADIFGLLETDPVLTKVLRQDFSQELLEHARKGVSPTFVAGYDPQGIEYLELYQVWHFNSGTRTYQPTHQLSFHGIGYELKEDRDMGGYVEKAGTRTQWGISLTDVRDLLALPLRLRPEVRVFEDDFDARAYGQELEAFHVEGVNLGQVLHGVLWELSFHGAPAAQEEVRDDLQERVEEVRAGTAETVSGSDIFDEMDRPGIELLFDSIGEHSVADVRWELRKLEDDEPVQAALAQALSDAVRVKPDYAQLPARAFRKLFRTAKYNSDPA